VRSAPLWATPSGKTRSKGVATLSRDDVETVRDRLDGTWGGRWLDIASRIVFAHAQARVSIR